MKSRKTLICEAYEAAKNIDNKMSKWHKPVETPEFNRPLLLKLKNGEYFTDIAKPLPQDDRRAAGAMFKYYFTNVYVYNIIAWAYKDEVDNIKKECEKTESSEGFCSNVTKIRKMIGEDLHRILERQMVKLVNKLEKYNLTDDQIKEYMDYIVTKILL